MPLPTKLYQTPGAVGTVKQVGVTSNVAPAVVPVVVEPQVIGIALAQRSLAGGGSAQVRVRVNKPLAEPKPCTKTK